MEWNHALEYLRGQEPSRALEYAMRISSSVDERPGTALKWLALKLVALVMLDRRGEAVDHLLASGNERSSEVLATVGRLAMVELGAYDARVFVVRAAVATTQRTRFRRPILALVAHSLTACCGQLLQPTRSEKWSIS